MSTPSTFDTPPTPLQPCDVFVSYAREDRSSVLAFKQLIESRGFTTWMDETHIRAGDALTDEIERAIATSGTVVVFWSAAANVSDWVKQEASAALRHGRLLPVSLDNSGPAPGFENLHTLSFDWEDGRHTNATQTFLARIGEFVNRAPNDDPETSAYANALDAFENGRRMNVSGVIARSTVGTTKAGQSFVRFDLNSPAGTMPCRRWDSADAPTDGSIVTVRGTILDTPRHGRQLGVDTVEEIQVVSPRSRYHAILEYLRRELRDSDRSGLTIPTDDRAEAVLLRNGQEPVVSGLMESAPFFANLLVQSDARQRANLTQLALNRGFQEVRLGYPLVDIARSSETEPEYQPLATLAVEVLRSAASPSGFRVRSLGKRLELNREVLKQLELPDDVIEHLAGNTSEAPLDLLRSCLDQSPNGIPSAILRPDVLSPNATGRILNAAAVFAPKPGNITRGLLRDYEQLRGWSAGDLAASAFGALVDFEPRVDEPLDFPFGRSLGRATLAQEEACAHALTRRLTVVTGPPGTGKSQLIANVVAGTRHAFASGLVAVTSTNNAAVDAVSEKARLSQHLSLVVRFGSAHNATAAQQIRSTLALERPELTGAELEQRWRGLAEASAPIYESDLRRRRLEAECLRLIIAARQARAALSPTTRRSFEFNPPEEFDAAASALERALDAARRLPWWRWLARWTALRGALAISREIGEQLGLTDENIPATVLELSRIVNLERTLTEQRTELIAQPDRETVDDQLDERIGQQRHELAFDIELEQTKIRVATLTPEARAAATDIGRLFENGRWKGDVTLVDRAAPLLSAWCMTLHSSSQVMPLRPGSVELLVIDESSQCLLQVAAPMLARSKRAMIVGDPQQLPAIDTGNDSSHRELNAFQAGLNNEDRARFGSDHTLYDLASESVAGGVVLLDRHFRCHEDIARFSLDTYYGGRVAVRKTPEPLRPDGHIRWLDCPAGSAGEKPRQNVGEAEAVVELVCRLVADGETSIGVITPFRDQLVLINRLLKSHGVNTPNVQVGTVHAFQGSDREVILFSPVLTSSKSTRMGFVDDSRLINVAVTRARSLFVVVGDRAVFRGRQHVGSLLDHIESVEFRRQTANAQT